VNQLIFHGTTIIGVKRDGKIALAGDGQVSMGNTIVKSSAKKVRKMFKDNIVAGFAGATADAFTLFDKFDQKLEEHNGRLLRAAVELAKDWRSDKYLRRLEALMIVADRETLLTLSGTGDVIETDDNVAAIGSGGPYALSAAKALVRETDLSARLIVEKALKIASEICVFTNDHITVEELG
jgi:ATP-dependent HslUV protease subunit HslV